MSRSYDIFNRMIMLVHGLYCIKIQEMATEEGLRSARHSSVGATGLCTHKEPSSSLITVIRTSLQPLKRMKNLQNPSKNLEKPSKKGLKPPLRRHFFDQNKRRSPRCSPASAPARRSTCPRRSASAPRRRRAVDAISQLKPIAFHALVSMYDQYDIMRYYSILYTY